MRAGRKWLAAAGRCARLASSTGLHDETGAAYDVLVWFGAMHRQFGYYDRYAAPALAFCARHDLTVHEASLLESRCVELVHRGDWGRAASVATDLLRAAGPEFRRQDQAAVPARPGPGAPG